MTRIAIFMMRTNTVLLLLLKVVRRFWGETHRVHWHRTWRDGSRQWPGRCLWSPHSQCPHCPSDSWSCRQTETGHEWTTPEGICPWVMSTSSGRQDCHARPRGLWSGRSVGRRRWQSGGDWQRADSALSVWYQQSADRSQAGLDSQHHQRTWGPPVASWLQ